MERLQKVIATSGYCSRRKAEELITNGKVSVNGNIITTIQDILDMSNHYMIGTCETPNNVVVEKPQYFLQNGADARINGIWNIDRDEDEIFIVHVKNKLYKLDTNFLNPVDMGITVADTITQYSSVILDNKLAVFDGSRAFWYGKSGGEWGIHYLDESGYIPLTSINRKPDGTGASSYEDVNILNPYRENSFVADGTSGVYYDCRSRAAADQEVL